MLRFEIAPKNRVMALFEASAIAFDLAPTSSLMDLAKRLSDLGDRHEGALIGLTVRVGPETPVFRLNGRGRDQKRDRR